jgi:mRNA interferase HicA
VFVNVRELKRRLAAKGCTFENHAGGSGHVTVRLDGRVSQLPMHGKGKELGTKKKKKILKDLGLKD